MPDLHQELAVLREFQDLIVVIKRAVFAPAVAADPHIALVIDGDAVVRIRPIVALARAAPVADEVALLVELQNGEQERSTPQRVAWRWRRFPSARRCSCGEQSRCGPGHPRRPRRTCLESNGWEAAWATEDRLRSAAPRFPRPQL